MTRALRKTKAFRRPGLLEAGTIGGRAWGVKPADVALARPALTPPRGRWLSQGLPSPGPLPADRGEGDSLTQARPAPRYASGRGGIAPAARPVLRRDLPVAAQQPAIGEQPLDADRAARVQLVGADADLGAEAVADSRRRTGCWRCGRRRRRRPRPGSARPRRASAVTIASVWREPWRVDVAPAPRPCRRPACTARTCAPNSWPKSPSVAGFMLGWRARVAAQPRSSTPAAVSAATHASSAAPAPGVPQQRLGARCRPPGRCVLRVDGQPRRHRRIGGGVQVEVADAGGVAHHRDARAAAGRAARTPTSRARRSPRRCRAGPAARRTSSRPSSSTGRARVDARAARARGGSTAVSARLRRRRLAAALEQDGVAALPGQPDDLHQRVGARLEHHAEQRRAGRSRARAPARRRARAAASPGRPDRASPASCSSPSQHAVELGGVEAQALDQRRRRTAPRPWRAFEIGGVGGEDRLRARPARAAPPPASRSSAERPSAAEPRQLAAGRLAASAVARIASASSVLVSVRHQTAPMTRLSRVMSAS